MRAHKGLVGPCKMFLKTEFGKKTIKAKGSEKQKGGKEKQESGSKSRK